MEDEEESKSKRRWREGGREDDSTLYIYEELGFEDDLELGGRRREIGGSRIWEK
jgi:hypothetical protein